MTSLSDHVVILGWSQSLQIAVVAAVATVFATAFGKRYPHLSYLLWMMVLVKALTPPVWTSPTSIFQWHGGTERTASAPAFRDPVADVVRSNPLVTEATPAAIVSTADRQSAFVGLRWPTLLATAWCCGALLTLGVHASGHLAFRRRMWRASQQADDRLSARVAAAAESVGFSRNPLLRITSLPFGPAVFGLWRPIIVLPESTLSSDQSDNLDAILAHELIHLRRRDPLHALLQLAAVSVWWWNPVVWAASRFATCERERCCDEEVLGTLRYPSGDYAQCMLDALRAGRQRSVGKLSLTLTALPVTRRRLESIMRPGHRFRPHPPRWLWAPAVVLGLLLLPSGGSAQRQAPRRDLLSTKTTQAFDSPDSKDDTLVSSELNPSAKAPQLVYLTWQKDGIRSTGRSTPHTLWDPDGKLLDNQQADELLKQVEPFEVACRREGGLDPLALVFRVDPRITAATVTPAVITANGDRHTGSIARNRANNGLIFSAAVPDIRALPKWPEQISLEIKYPIDNIAIIRTLTEIPDDPVEIAAGVKWYLDPTRVHERDEETDRSRPARNKTAGVLQKRADLSELVSYDVRVYLRGQQGLLRSDYGTVIEEGGQDHLIRVSRAFQSKDEIERVEIIRQHFNVRRIKNVRLRLDLLPKGAG